MNKYKYVVVKKITTHINAKDDNDLLNLYSEGVIDEKLYDAQENADYTFYRVNSNGKWDCINNDYKFEGGQEGETK